MFRAMWLAVLVSNIGTWINDVSASWIMAERTGSPLMVAMVQAATTVPMLLLAIVAGTLADIVDRRRYMIAAQLLMMGAATGLATLAHLDRLDPAWLLGLTFVAGVGAALAGPAQQATTPELVPRTMLPAAISLGGLSMNIARAFGPALGGLILASFGAAWSFTLNALSFVGMLVVLLRWRRAPRTSTLPPERFAGALRAGLRYAAQAPVLQAVLVRAAAFFLFASAASALMPLVAQRKLAAGPFAYGALLGCIGIGAIIGAVALPRIRKRLDRDALIFVATGAYAICMVALACVPRIEWLYPAMLASGFAWIAVLSSLQVAAQSSVPAWVRARALSLYIVVFSGGMALGSLGWGWLAQHTSLQTALLAAAATGVLAAIATQRYRIAGAEQLRVMPSAHWPEPAPPEAIEGERGPVLVTVEYRVRTADRRAFLALMQELGRSRRRDGALQWGVFEDTDHPGTYQEYFVAASWLDHLRQHERVTEEERALQERIRLLQTSEGGPTVRHFVGGEPGTPIAVDLHPNAEIESRVAKTD